MNALHPRAVTLVNGLAILSALVIAPIDLVPDPAHAACDGASHLRWTAGLSHYQFVPGGAEQGTLDLAAVGSFLLVPDLYWGLYSYEITAPGVVEFRDHLEAAPRRIEAQGSFVYLAEENGVRVVEVGPAGEFVPRGSVGGIDPAGFVDLAVDGDYAYLAGWSGLQVLSIADPDAPSVVATLPGDCARVVVSGNRAYVSRITGLWTVDISTPSNPAFIGTGIAIPTLHGLAVDGSTLYGAATASGLHVFDLTDPDEPLEVEALPFTGGAEIALGDGYVIVGETSFCRIFDTAGSNGGALSRATGCLGGLVADGFAYLASGELGLQVLELGAATSPEPVASFPQWAWASHLTRFGSALALLTDTGLEILDVGDPEAPVVVGSLPFSLPLSLCTDGDYLYVVSEDGLSVVDASSPAAPTVVGFVADVFGQISTADAGLAYVSFGFALYVVDVSVPTDPFIVSAEPISTVTVESLAAVERDLYMAASFEGIGVLSRFDYSNPAAPSWIGEAISSPITDVVCTDAAVYTTGRRETCAWSRDLDLDAKLATHGFGGISFRPGLSLDSGGRLASINMEGGFHLYETTGTLHYVSSGATPTPGALGIVNVGNHVYVVDTGGLRIYRGPCESAGIDDDGGGGGDDGGSDGGADGSGGGSGGDVGGGVGDHTNAQAHGRLEVTPNPTQGPVRLAWTAPSGTRIAANGERGAGVVESAVEGAVESVVEIFDVGGRRIRTLPGGLSARGPVDGSLAIGTRFETEWDGRDESGRLVPAGLFFARVRGGDDRQSQGIRVVR